MNGATRTWSHWPVKRPSASSTAASSASGRIQRTNTPPPLNPSFASPAHTVPSPASSLVAARQQRGAVDRHDLVRWSSHASPVEERVACGLVLEGQPLGAAPPVAGSAAEVGRGRERRKEHECVAVRVEALDRLDDRRGRIGHQPLDLAELVDGVDRVHLVDDPVGLGVGRQVAGALPGRDDQERAGTERLQRPQEHRGRSQQRPREDHLPPLDPCPDHAGQSLGDLVRLLHRPMVVASASPPPGQFRYDCER